MEVIALVISVLGLSATMFAIGYQIGKDSNQSRNDRPKA